MGARRHRRLIRLICAEYPLAKAALATKRMRRELAYSRLGDTVRSAGAGRITSSSVLAHRASTPHAGPQSGLSRDVLRNGRDLLQHGPEKTDELPRHGDDRDRRSLAIRQMIESLRQPLLRRPRVREYRQGVALLAPLASDARLWPMAITPRRLDQHMAAVTVAGLVIEPSRCRAPLEASIPGTRRWGETCHSFSPTESSMSAEPLQFRQRHNVRWSRQGC